MARAAKKIIEAAEQQVGQDSIRVIKNGPDGTPTLSDAVIETVPGPNWKAHADALAFMEEPVEVLVHESADKNAQAIVETGVNGVSQRFIRGVPITVKRKYVERLARAKPISYGQEKYVDHDGFDAYRYPSRTGLLYPFSVIHDANPLGAPWLRKVLAEA